MAMIDRVCNKYIDKYNLIRAGIRLRFTEAKQTTLSSELTSAGLQWLLLNDAIKRIRELLSERKASAAASQSALESTELPQPAPILSQQLGASEDEILKEVNYVSSIRENFWVYKCLKRLSKI